MCISFRSCSVEKNIAFLQRAWSRRIDKDEKGEEGVRSADRLALQLHREASFPTLFSKSKTVMVPTGLSVDLNIFHILQHLRLWSTLLYLCMCILDWTHGSIVFDVLFKNISHEALCICVHMSILYLVSSNPLLYLNIAYVWSFKQLYEVPIWKKLNYMKTELWFWTKLRFSKHPLFQSRRKPGELSQSFSLVKKKERSENKFPINLAQYILSHLVLPRADVPWVCAEMHF